MAFTHILGYPRIGARRELQMALEAFWRKEADEAHLQGVAVDLKQQRWQAQQAAGLSCVTAGDFALYDPMLSQAALLGALPARFGFDARQLTLDQYFALARGNAQQPAMEAAQWFDTNYHHLVPELGPHTQFSGGPDTFFDEVREARAQGLRTKPVLIGPLTWLYLARSHVAGFDRLSLLPALVDAFARILLRLGAVGIEWVQLDEPALGLDLPAAWLAAYDTAYAQLALALKSGDGPSPKLLLATYFEGVGEHARRMAQWPVQGYHIDLVRAPDQLAAWVAALPAEKVLSVGVIDGRNIWRTDLDRALATLKPLHAQLQHRLWVAPSCSLAHVPVSLAPEARLDAEVKGWLAFAQEKLGELGLLGQALNLGEDQPAVAPALAVARASLASRRQSGRLHNPVVLRQLQALTPQMSERQSPFHQRSAVQRESLQLPPLPTTTIGPFPQTPAIRQAKAAYKRRDLSALDYLQRMRQEIKHVVDRQVALGLDVLVHGEAERTDMVAYFAEQLWGFALTEHGWVQSQGSCCVKPPILYGDVYRPEPMTVETTRYAQSLTDKPVKGLLTGPVTMLQWSFVRDDQPREVTALQLALAIRAEVLDLEKAGIGIIQIDEPAFGEGLPIKQRDWARYLDGAVRAFKVSSCVVNDATQIHAHTGDSAFKAILPSIAALDADVITIETSRSAMALLDGLGELKYPNEIGPGVCDTHSPQVPSVDSMVHLLEQACEVVPAERLWVNPHGGLKARGWPETEEALRRMVQATLVMRERLGRRQAA